MATRKRKRSAGAEVLQDLSKDWYWEQDAELRFTRADAASADERALAAAIIGKKRWETGIEVEGGWEAHRAILEARAPFRDVLMWRRLEDGSRRYFTVSGEPVTDDRGRFAGYRGIGRDITKQKRMQQLLRLQQAVTRRLAESANLPQALSGALQAICEAEGWDSAEFWRHDAGAATLNCIAHWNRPDDSEARRFIEDSVNRSLKPGAGLVGTVCQTGEAMWLADTTRDARGLRKALVERTGLRGAAMLPVTYGGRVGGVVAFHSRRIRPPDKRLAQALNAIVTQIGEYLQRVEAEQALRDSEARFRSLTNLSSDWFWEQDSELRFTRIEGRFVAGGDQALRQRLLGTRRWESGLHMDGGWDAHRALLEARQPFHDAVMWRPMADGSRRYVSVSGEPVFDADGRFTGYRGVGRDVTGQKRVEQMLRESEERFRSLTQMSSDFFWETDAEHRLAQLVHGPNYSPAYMGRGIIGKTAWQMPSLSPDEAGWAAHRAMLDQHLPFREFEFARAMPDGVQRHFSISGQPRYAADGVFCGYRGVGRDITDIAFEREHIAALAYSDPLTGLANRASLGPSLEQAVQRARRRNAKLAVVFVDLDAFKQVNDLLGHDAGDALLIEVAQRLRKHLRASDLVARPGGDEFLVVLEDIAESFPVETVARKLLSELERPYLLGGREARVSASIGISVYPDDAVDSLALMKHADTAMYAAKQAGKNTFRFYTAAPAANEPVRDGRSDAA